jgi:hypothetical protein
METPTKCAPRNGRSWAALGLALTLIAFAGGGRATAQTFNSGSDETEGALTLPASQGTIVFDPRDTVRWGKVLDPDGDGVYHFTTITIGAGTTLKLAGDKVNKPIHFLASGAIVITGDLFLDGGSYTTTTQLFLRRLVPIPGAGGYAAGAGGQMGGVPATPGEGPGGGSGGVTTGSPCHPTQICGKGGTFTGNRYLVPMTGGSGGEGGRWQDGNFYSGGAGGGAILLASSTSIAIHGPIFARGGNSNVGGGGAGGAIRVVAPVLTGSGSFHVNGGTSATGQSFGTNGWVRLEGFQISTSFSFGAGSASVTRGAPVDAATLRPSGSVRVAAIGGIPLPIYPSGTFALPDAAINSADPVSIDIEATGIPPGTVVTLRVSPDTPEDSAMVSLPEVQATLQGTLQQSTATVQFSFPYGFSRGYVRATWTQ